MRQIRFYVDMPLADAHTLVLPTRAAHHAVRVLRLGAGHAVTLFNGDGCDYAGTIASADGSAVRVQLQAGKPVATEAPWPLTLAQCMARGDKMDLVVQKATELGATRIVPLLSERSEVRLGAERAAKRQAHWQAIAISACEQCGRARIPCVATPQTLEAWASGLDGGDALRLALLPGARRRVRELRLAAAGAIVVVGPEGGLGQRDIKALTQAGFIGLALGPRILRTETAGLAALAALQACHGDA